MKNIILLSDGTGNSAAKIFKTNVWRFYEALELNCPDQVALYDDGVGTASVPILAMLGGAFGWGLKRNVLDLYVFACRNYRQDDRLFDPKSFCHATGISLQQDARYSVEVFPEDFLRYSYRPSWLVYPLFPLRRVLQADWFVPVARVGSTGAEHYPLTGHVSAFTAQRSGQLMVFLNDLVLPWPNWDTWYADNPDETACIRVTRISSDERQPPSTMAPPPGCVDSSGNLIVSLAIRN